MIDDDEDLAPESDPMCAHWHSVYNERHAPVPCVNCGKPCHDHLVLWGSWCPDVEPGSPALPTNKFLGPDGETQ